MSKVHKIKADFSDETTMGEQQDSPKTTVFRSMNIPVFPYKNAFKVLEGVWGTFFKKSPHKKYSKMCNYLESNATNSASVFQKSSIESKSSASSGECKSCTVGAMEIISIPATLEAMIPHSNPA